MLLSACLIVKNEELVLDKCLSSLKDVADEIIVVDTGSTDSTIEIARKYTDKIFHYNWDNNFANARNESIRHSNSKYNLIIDADEYLDEHNKFEIRNFLQTNEIAGAFLTVKNYTGYLTRKMDFMLVHLLRIIRNGYNYTEAIHEQVDEVIFASEKPVVSIEAIIHHVGYVNQIIDAKQKIDRNKTILNNILAANPDDIFQRINLVAEYLRNGEYEDALKTAEKCYQDFDIVNKLKENEEAPKNAHIVARSYKLYIVALMNLSKQKKAIEIAMEASSILPMITDYMYYIAYAYNDLRDWSTAVKWFQKCIAQGDTKVGLYDMVVGTGSYLSHLGLGDAWSKLGDEQLAMKYFMLAFLEQPMVSPNIVFYILHYISADATLAYEYVESKIIDLETYHFYAETYVNFHMPDALAVIERAEKKFGRSIISERSRVSYLLRKSIHEAEEYIRNINADFYYFWLGIIYLDANRLKDAEQAFEKSDDTGKTFWVSIKPFIINDTPITLPIVAYARDIIAMNAKNLFMKWVPYATDIEDAWVYFKYSPFRNIFESIEWVGDSIHQYEQNAVLEFNRRNISKAKFWLDKATQFTPTVTKIMLEADIALAEKRSDYAIKILAFGKIIFEESIVIDQALNNFLNTSDAMAILFPAGQSIRLEDLLMNPYDSYRKNVIDTMPINVQLAQLHERGAMLTRQVKLEAENSDLQSARNHIQELQEIFTFLRSSLNPNLEISVQTDETYLFYYKVLIRWYLSPTEIPEEYDALMLFWQTWAQTWAKASNK